MDTPRRDAILWGPGGSTRLPIPRFPTDPIPCLAGDWLVGCGTTPSTMSSWNLWVLMVELSWWNSQPVSKVCRYTGSPANFSGACLGTEPRVPAIKDMPRILAKTCPCTRLPPPLPLLPRSSLPAGRTSSTLSNDPRTCS